ncbi:MAG TPA: division/cell wall cluster transcriptional repressor MraZ [Bacilli bacterium]|nr:division/cell wall cluster transcriptional repressor MraZ [Bacilli bacterium]
MFMGEYHHSIDDKGRVIMPSKFRYDLGETFVITRGIDSCLFVYPKETWMQLTSKLNELSFTKKDVRSFQRFFLSAATICEFDKQGRINITSPLADYAGLTKECVVIGVNDRIEIWSKDNFDKFLNDNISNVSEIAEHLFEGVM